MSYDLSKVRDCQAWAGSLRLRKTPEGYARYIGYTADEQEHMAHLTDHRPMGGPSDAQREAYLWLQEEFVRACGAAGLDPAEPASRRWANHNFSAHQRRKRERNQAE